MNHVDTDYLRSLKTTLLGDPAGSLVLICNFEVEDRWAKNYVGLPAPGFPATTSVVRRMSELGVLLAGTDDILVLKRPLDPGYRNYLRAQGLPQPTVLVPENVEMARSTAEDALDSPALLDRLTTLAAAGARLLPMGTSAPEQKLADTTGLPLAVPDAATFERVNSKIYSRRLTATAGLREVPGRCCETCDDLTDILGDYRPTVTQRPIVVKDAYGVSGKGLLVLDAPDKVERLLRMVRRRAERTGDARLHVVVEEWLPKQFDLNYQVTVARDGAIRLDFVKQALTENGVHKGHIMPAEISAAAYDDIEYAAGVVGRRLHEDGYHGVIGVDAVVGIDGVVYPVLEINARLNMSTYQGSVTERCQPAGHVALARHYTLRLTEPCAFGELSGVLDPVLGRFPTERFVITCFGTVNADADREPPFAGRLYAVLVAPDRARLAALDTAVRSAISAHFHPEERP
jgi:hypothetical protein